MERDGFIKKLDLEEIRKRAEQMDSGYIDGSMFVSMDYETCGKRFLSPGQPYLLNEGRAMRILSGEAAAFINLERRRLEPGMCLIVPPHSVFEIERLGGDFQLQVFSFSEIQGEGRWDRVLAVRLDAAQWDLAGRYFDLIGEESLRKPVNKPAVRCLQSALLECV